MMNAPWSRDSGILLSLWCAICWCVAPAAAADTFPGKPVRIIVPVAAGGNLDIVARSLAERLAAGMGQSVIVENRPSASSLVGTQFVAKSAPDGYTLLAIGNTFLSTPAIVANAGYDPVADFVGVSLVCRIPEMLVVPASSPLQTLGDLIAQAKARPGALSYATAGSGSVAHIAAEVFSRHAGITLQHIPYKGNAQAIIDVIGGRVDLMFDQVSTSAANIRSGALRALGVTALTRSPLFPNIATLDELGLKGFEDVTINAVMAPAGTPRDVVARLHAEIARAALTPELRNRFASQGIEMAPSASPEEFTAYVRSEVARYARLAREANIKAQ